MPDWLDWDERSNILTIDGIKFDRVVFDFLAHGSCGKCFTLVKRDEDGRVTLTEVRS